MIPRTAAKTIFATIMFSVVTFIVEQLLLLHLVLTKTGLLTWMTGLLSLTMSMKRLRKIISLPAVNGVHTHGI